MIEALTRLLDGHVAEAGLAQVDLVKLDVEGFRPAVLAGAAGLIERFGLRRS